MADPFNISQINVMPTIDDCEVWELGQILDQVTVMQGKQLTHYKRFPSKTMKAVLHPQMNRLLNLHANSSERY